MKWLLAPLFFLLLTFSASAANVRIKDLVEVDGVRGNDLVGYGLVIGLDGYVSRKRLYSE